MVSRLIRFWDWLVSGGGIIAAVILFFLIVFVNYEVIMRYLLNSPTAWVVTLTEYSMLYLLFLSTALVLQRERHVRMDLLLNSLRPRVRRILNTITSLVGAVVCAILFWYSLQLTMEAYQAKFFLETAIITPKWLVLMPMPLGSFFLTIQFLRRAWLIATKGQLYKQGNSPSGDEPGSK